MTTSPTPDKRNLAEKAVEGPRGQTEGWEFCAIPWTFPFGEPHTLDDGWEPFGVHYIQLEPRDKTKLGGEGGTMLIVRRRT